ncbi:hypothetical protein QQS21_001002 [Conoideocrella luteorostrata]|uniref:Ubiquitin-like domain-containing protein n=1 Tax=Conoideocrella luteorostrata TaxID=1105319 RepID=A0AAJ0CXP2_9HYPO|nr:hypothetical protein QQS21_001002 [Conoideocrella luteorostrata]
MASETATSRNSRATEELAVNLQIVSPSAGVNRPLLFPDLPAATTIKQLKEKIRHALPLRPADENQRLIHLGRALLRESDNLLTIFGADALQTLERQTIHLVIRDPNDSHSSSPAPTSASGPSLVPGSNNSVPTAQHATPIQPPPPNSFNGRTHSVPAAAGGSHGRMPSPSPPYVPHPTEPATVFYNNQQPGVTNWVSQIQREAMSRAIVHQNQRGRAHMGMRGIGDSTGVHNHTGGNNTNNNSGRASPAASSQFVYRETFSPDGQSYHVETVVRSSAPSQQQNGLSAIDVQNILRGADANQATAARASAMHGSAPSPSILTRPLNQPGVTTPIFNPSGQLAGSGRATPDPSSANSVRSSTDVYILSSPEGPRGLLVNHATSETYYTPRLRPRGSMPYLRPATSFSNLSNVAMPPPPMQNTHHQNTYQQSTYQQQQLQQQQLQQQQLQQQQLQQQQQFYLQPYPSQHQPQQPAQQLQGEQNAEPADNVPPAPAAGQQPGLHPVNPPAAGIPPLLLQAWPHIWLILRLAVFVWLFTSPNSSWSRWFTVICLAILVYLLSTGILNGVAENAWRPIGRHLQNLLPTPEQHVRREQRAAGSSARGPEEQEPLIQARDLDPAQLAARLVAERERQSWVGLQLRRLERAGLLFLASIAPGVAERHIANLEAETQAEETRRRDAEAAAAAAAAASATSVGTDGIESVESQNTNETGVGNQAQDERSQVDQLQGEPQGNVGGDGIRDQLVDL